MRRSKLLLTTVWRYAGITLSLSGLLSAQGFVIPSGSTLPFADIRQKGLAIDASCSADGNSGNDLGKKLESNAKNNFWVTGKSVPITYAVFKQLQAATPSDVRTTLKTDRSVLQDIVKPRGATKSVGEGSLVQYVGFLLDAHNSNVGDGELVNCKKSGKDANDVHIELVNTSGEDDACASVTAEMSPHMRPESWSDLVNLTVRRPIRVTGPLFFDGSHQPCHDDKRPSPNRISVWEIHPVYQFDVCKNKSLGSCKPQDKTVWIPLDQWHNHADNEADEN